MYDFTTTTNRMVDGAVKWAQMAEEPENFAERSIPMTIADMEFVLPEEISKPLCDYAYHRILGYTQETPEYRKIVCDFMKNYHGYEIQPEWLVTSPGVVSALATSIRSFSHVGDGVIIMPPIYPPFYAVVEGQGRVLEKCPLQLMDKRYEIDFDLFEMLAKKESTKIFLLCSPHNPGGRVWTVKELRRLADICLENNVLIVSDEIHGDIMLTSEKHTILGAIGKDIEDFSVVCTAASKTFNIAGLQCSNIIIPNEEIRTRFVQENKSTGIDRANVLGMVATAAAYQYGMDWLKELKEVIRNNIEMVEYFFNKYPKSFIMTKPEASFLVWVNYEGTGLSREEFMKLLEDHRFFVNDGIEYGAEGEYFIRINVGLPEKDLKENLRRLEEALGKYDILN